MHIPTDRMVQVGSVRTRYWVEGEGTPVVLIHGLSNCMEDWLLNIPALATQHRVYALDLIGHGKTDKPLSFSYTFADFAHFVRDFMDTLSIPRAHLVGHSLGSAVAVLAVQQDPFRFGSLVLIDSAGIAREISTLFRLISLPGLGELMGALVLRGDLEKRMAFQRQSWPDASVVPDEMILQKLSATRWEDIQKTYFKTLRGSCNALGMKKSAYQPVQEALSSLKNPLLVIWGAQDDLVPVSHIQIIQERVPHVCIEVFAQGKHDPMITEPERFNQLVLNFLSQDVGGLGE